MAIKGGAQIKRNYAKIEKSIQDATRIGLAEAGKFIEGKSKDGTPVDLGNLQDSHYTEPGGTRKSPVIEIGTTANYSVYVHEDMNARHTVGRAKFLQKAAYENADKILRGLATAIKKRLAK